MKSVTQHKLLICDARIIKVKISARTLYQHGVNGSSNKLNFVIRFFETFAGYGDDLDILAETFEGLMVIRKNGLEPKGLKVNMGKTKVMISGRDLHTLQTSGKYPEAVCRKELNLL